MSEEKKWAKLEDLARGKLTPMLRQYLQAKASCGDALLFFRMGDFFELFFEDALVAAELLGLSLTSRDGVGKESRVPMAGMPARNVETYIARAIRAGKTVCLCDQVEDPREAKGIVKRSIIRTITPGTVMEPDLLDENSNNYLGGVFLGKDKAGLVFLDVTTGEFLVAQLDGDIERTLQDEITRMAPVEIICADHQEDSLVAPLRTRFEGIAFQVRPEHEFDLSVARDQLQDTYELSTLKGLGLDDCPEAIRCAGAVLGYVRDTQRDRVPHLQLPTRYSPSGYVVLDSNTQRNLELTASLHDGSKRGTLLGVLDRTQTSMGGRKLRHWILHPLVAVEAIQGRLEAVEALHDDTELRMALRSALREVSDLERLLSRITAKSGNARDLKALGRSLAQAPRLRALIADRPCAYLQTLHTQMDDLADVSGWIEAAIVEEPPLTIMEGGLIKDGYNDELDHIHKLVRGGKDWIAELQEQEQKRTGINKLKVGYNKVFGYYIEISRANLHLVPEDYERKQTLVNAERFITQGLKEREEEIIHAQERMHSLEHELFVALREQVSQESRRIQQTADAIATLDVLLSLAEVAVTKGYTRPRIDDEGELHIRDGRHPVVEDLMARNDFVPNDAHLDPFRATLQIVTGPNMAGKSTYLRQVALITLMAQIGAFVPAAEARIGVVDRIFTRVGASDNLARGESTFMVEMIETANILNTATARSLLVLDEIGRGTSTFDGISIAWSVAEHIHDQIGAKTLFATHYHELTELANQLERAKNLNVAVREWGEKVVFLYRIAEGGADHSYGIQVAKLAGLPPAMLKRARAILETLESGNTAALGLPQQMYLFDPYVYNKPEASPVEKELQGIDLDSLSPREAQEFLYHLKAMLQKQA